MGSVAQLHDPQGEGLIRRAESAGGIENLSAGEQWRVARALDARRRHEAHAARQDSRTDALSSQALERRFAVLEAHVGWASWMLQDGVGTVVGEALGEERQRATAKREEAPR